MMFSSRQALIFLITFVTICGIFKCLFRTQASVTHAQTTRPVIGGRWQLVHVSIGLEHLPSTIASPLPTIKPQTAHRVDFRARKRAMYPSLHFTPDALRSRRVSLSELVVLFRRIALEEAKADAPRSETKKGRSRVRKGR